MAQRWDNELREYKPYELPEGAVTYCPHLSATVTCADCGKSVRYGDTYTSSEIHTSTGVGYAICETCMENEIQRRNRKVK